MQAQTDWLDVYRSMISGVTETFQLALRNMERVNEQQLHWVRAAMEKNHRLTHRLAEARNANDLFLAHSEHAFSQAALNIEVWWRLCRAMQDGQMAVMSSLEAQVVQTTRAARRLHDQASRSLQDASSVAFSPAGGQAGSDKQATAWDGVERRTATVVPFAGPERRKAAHLPGMG